ncbi:MAG: sugar ABC transporter substrate-binding protein [Rhizobiaceae bacterium]|nr:sugar ABC transporter substrate-binding protein [Rhizobiaceae bacterium]
MPINRRSLILAGTLLTSAAWLGVLPARADEASLLKWADGIKAQHDGSTIRVLGISHPASDAMKAMTPEFESATGIKVEWEIVGSGEIMSKQFLAQTAGESSYDVYMVKGTALAEYDAKSVLADLGERLEATQSALPDYDFDDIHLAYRGGLGVLNDKTIGIPVAGETFFISYRKDLFDKYDRKPPQTMDELLETAKFFHEKEPGLYGISMRAETGRTLALTWDLFNPAFGGSILDQKTWDVKIDTPATKRSLDYLLELLSYGPPDIETYSWDAAVSAYASGKTAMWFDATSLQSWLVDPEKSKVVGKIGYVAPPSGPEGRFGPVGGWSLGLPSTSKQQDAGWAFIVWMTSKTKAMESFEKGGVPSRLSVLQDPKFTEADPEFAKALKESLDAAGNLIETGRRWIPATPEATKIDKVAGYWAGQALLKQMTVEEALKAAVPELQEISDKIKADK